MADGPTGPDFGAMLALNRFSQQSNGSGRPVILAGVLPGGGADVNVGGQLTSNGFKEATFKATAPARPGMFRKLLADMGVSGAGIMDGMKKVADAGAPRQVNSITEIQGQASTGGSSASFADNLGPRGGGGMDLG